MWLKIQMERDDYNFLEDIPKHSLMSTKCHSKYANRKKYTQLHNADILILQSGQFFLHFPSS